MNYVVISKENRFDRPINVGKIILMSFAQIPLWKGFYWIKAQGDDIPKCYDKATAMYALNKYANDFDFEVKEYSEVLKEFNQFNNQTK